MQGKVIHAKKPSTGSKTPANNKQKAANLVHSKVKPVVVKHVLPQGYIQKPEVFQDRPTK